MSALNKIGARDKDVLYAVFTDLDGSLLDHNSYRYDHAVRQIHELRRLGIPLIFVSSKTKAEIVTLRNQMGNSDPFIVENGSAIFIPKHYFDQTGHAGESASEYEILELAESRERWLEQLDKLERNYYGEFVNFEKLPVRELMNLTGLSYQDAKFAADRHYTEPVKWLGTDERKDLFISVLEEVGAQVETGGRFLSVGGCSNKGHAVTCLRNIFVERSRWESVIDLAIGDSNNDRSMLEISKEALLIRSPNHNFPVLTRKTGVFKSKAFGPIGWAEGVSAWLERYRLTAGIINHG